LHEETEIAEYISMGVDGAINNEHVAMMYDGMTDSTYESCAGSAIVIKFTKIIRYVNLKLYTGPSRDSYSNICLYAEGRKISCTPTDLTNPGDKIHFQDYTVDSSDIYGQEFRLSVEDTSNCIQIAELYMYYYEGKLP